MRRDLVAGFLPQPTLIKYVLLEDDRMHNFPTYLLNEC